MRTGVVDNECFKAYILKNHYSHKFYLIYVYWQDLWLSIDKYDKC